MGISKETDINVLDTSLSGQLEGFINTAYSFGRYGVSIYVLWYAYTVLAGKQKSPVHDFIWNLTRLFVILMFVKNMDGWLNYTLTGIDGLKETLSGNQDAWLWLDQLWIKVRQVAAHIMSKDRSTYVKTDSSIGALFTYGGGCWFNSRCDCVSYGRNHIEDFNSDCSFIYFLPDVRFSQADV